MFTTQQSILLLDFLVPMASLVSVLWIWQWVRGFQKERAPVSEKLLRPAGESLRRKLEKLDDRVNDCLMWAFLGPGMVAAMFVTGKPLPRPNLTFLTTIIALVIVGGWFAYQVWKLVGLLQQRRNYRLGFAGERAVAEELNQLMLDGCRIFHDVPMEPYGNVDHVVVAPGGVYAVEAKARRKRKAPPGKRDHEVTFDGDRLNFPTTTDTKPIQQARQQADRLRKFLSKAVGETVHVRPILTFPGWYVTTRSKSDLSVLNPKNIRSAVLNGQQPALPENLRQRVIHQLDQKCRDVEF
ncbi:MAG: nuclease-related domain-containing protein [Chthoniobacteraceae bacterium]